jgi:hypothetical protein
MEEAMPKPAKSLPSYEYLHECLWYEPERGTFTWHARPQAHFATARHCNIFNSLWAEKPAGYLSRGYRLIGIDYLRFNASRVAWVMMTGEDPGIHQLDHINMNRADDRWINLRLATNAQNNQNRKTQANHLSSPYKGVKPNGRNWMASIRANGMQHYLGTFDTPEAAHAAYVEAARRLHGSFAREG